MTGNPGSERHLDVLYDLVARLPSLRDADLVCSAVARGLVGVFGPTRGMRVEVELDGAVASVGPAGRQVGRQRVSVLVDGEERGCVGVVHPRPERLDEQERRLLSGVADLLAGWTRARVTEMRLDALVEHRRNAVAFVDDDGHVRLANQVLATLLGAGPHVAPGMRLHDHFGRFESRTGSLADAWDAMRRQGRVRAELDLLAADGTTRRVEIEGIADVLPELHLLTIRDVTASHRKNRELRRSEERFRALAEHSAEGIFVQRIKPEVGFDYINPAMARTIGYGLAELYADPQLLRRGISEEDRARMWASLGDGALEHGDVEVDFRNRRGDVQRLRLRGAAIRDADGDIEVIHAVATDVTAQRREEEALRRAIEQQRQLNDLKTGFVQAVSHELRTPLTTVLGFVELLLHRDLTRDEQRQYLERIHRGATKLERLVGDVLDLDRLERPGAMIATDVVDLAEIAARVIEESPAEAHVVRTDLRAAAVVGDDALLERVVDNLVRNAFKHTPPGTTIWVRTRAPAVLVVEDDGPGVPRELHERIFEPFQQGPGQLGRHSPGTGIGLSLAQRVVRLHGGSITLGDRPGGGARFVVALNEPDRTDTSRLGE